ncbi:acyl-CoA-binding domain-containing protein 5 [Galendromus occidentalis]|uniref:Acyl-CoA-binding domain-containing protein 5 n=1 Tax=Galendromus occidentalis TaxID=34638 RepID=A0AAJ6QTL1_9ACAR|nr:acyl-CoA-binding domain-containing protein 5 [Galendromus occidentalis]
MSVNDRFKAAVEIIRSLPKNGSFQPPYSMQLTFYSYYKQATTGPCQGARPAFWDIVGRAKYDAWQKLGAMEKETAMQQYVSEFVDTIKQLQANATPAEVQEALSYAEPKHIGLFKPLFESDNSINYDNVPAEFRDNNRGSPSDDDIEKIDGHESDEEYSDTFNNIEAERNSPEQADIVNSRSVIYKNSRNNAVGAAGRDDSHIIKAGGGDPREAGPPPPSGYYVSSGRDQASHSNRGPWPGEFCAHGAASRASGGGRNPNHPVGYVQPVDNLSYAVVRLQYTMDEVVRRLDNLERTLHEQRSGRWSFFGGIQPHVMAAILGWPLLLQLILYFVRRRRVRVQLRLK